VLWQEQNIVSHFSKCII